APSAHAPWASKFLEVRGTTVPQPHWQLKPNLVSALRGRVSASRLTCSFQSLVSADPTRSSASDPKSRADRRSGLSPGQLHQSQGVALPTGEDWAAAPRRLANPFG